MSDQIELRAAAARLMYNDNRDIRDYYMLIEFIDECFGNEPVVVEIPEGFVEELRRVVAVAAKIPCKMLFPYEETITPTKGERKDE